MANVLTQKRVRYFEWNVLTPAECGTRVISESFLYEDCTCNLEFSINPSDGKSCLYFKSSRELSSPITVTICVMSDSEGVIDYLKDTITGTCQTIWTHTKALQTCNLTFELIFPEDHTQADSLRQIAPAIDFDRFGRSRPDLRTDRLRQKAPAIDFDRFEENLPDLTNEKYLDAEVCMESLFVNFSELLETGLHHDVEIKCEGQSIMAHKLVLSTRSSVFRVMLQSESQAKVIEIQDIDASYFQDFIRYLYTNQTPELTFDRAKALYIAGHSYDIRSLKDRCSDYLQLNLSPKNAFECYNLADAHSDQTLKDTVKVYLLKEKKKTPFLPVML